MKHVDTENDVIYSDDDKEPLEVVKYKSWNGFLEYNFGEYFGWEKDTYLQKELYRADNGKYFVRWRWFDDEVHLRTLIEVSDPQTGRHTKDCIVLLTDSEAKQWYHNLEDTTKEDYEEMFDTKFKHV